MAKYRYQCGFFYREPNIGFNDLIEEFLQWGNPATYEKACMEMVLAGLRLLEDASRMQPCFKTKPGCYTKVTMTVCPKPYIVKGNVDGDYLIDRIVEEVNEKFGKPPTCSMVRTACEHIDKAQRIGLEEFKQEMGQEMGQKNREKITI